MTISWLEVRKRAGGAFRYEVVRTHLNLQTRYQKLTIVDVVGCGRCMFLDGEIQSAESDEFIYHEALVHPAMVCAPAPHRVFVAGGGEGATLREVLRHRGVEEVVMVDVDGEVVEAARRYLPQWSAGAFDDPRVRLVHADARAYLERDARPYDVIVVDVTDPLAGGPSYRLFTQEFYRLAHDRLVPGGAIAVQAESADVGASGNHFAIFRTLGAVFPRAREYHTHVPSFGESWGFVVGCKPADVDAPAVDPATLAAEQVDAILASRGCGDLRFYDGITHRRLFSPTKLDRELARQAGPVITDERPLTIST